MTVAAFADPAVKAAFNAHGAAMRDALLKLRGYILDVAAEHAAIGELVETLKWGEPAYLPKSPRTGTTVRLNAVKSSQDRYAAYFHCKTTLIASFRELYADHFLFQGDRAIIFSLAEEAPEQPFKHCVTLALTYHLNPGRGALGVRD